MKKTAFLLLISAYLLNGCHSNTNPVNSTDSKNVANATDTAKTLAVTPQPADTSIKDGVVIKKYPNGIIKERSSYLSGRRQGECQSFYPNGKLQSDDFFVGGLIDGSTTVYYDNGEKEYEGACNKGKPSGVWKFYDNKGTLVRSKNYGNVNSNPVM